MMLSIDCPSATLAIATTNFLLLLSVLFILLSRKAVEKSAKNTIKLQDKKIDLNKMRRLSGYLEELEPSLSNFFLLAEDLLCISSTEGYFLKVNPSWTRALGWSAEELTSQPYINFVHPEDVQQTLEVAGRTHEPVARFHNRYRCKDGSYKTLSWVASAHTESGKCYAVAREI